MANIYKRRISIRFDKVCITLSASLYKIVNKQMLEKAIKQINKLPAPIPKITGYKKDKGEPLENDHGTKIQKVRDLVAASSATRVQQVHIAYEPGEKYSLGNSVGRVFASNGGLIVLNDVRLKQVAGEPPHETYLVNLIIHELLHVYGIDHAAGLGFFINNKPFLRNRPVMNAGKFAFVGMSQDDIAGMRENYAVPQRKRVTLTVNAPSGHVGLIHKDKKKHSQGKTIRDGVAIFPQLKKAKYDVYLNGVKKKTVTVKKDQEITL